MGRWKVHIYCEEINYKQWCKPGSNSLEGAAKASDTIADDYVGTSAVSHIPTNRFSEGVGVNL
jgi:hypothetical protein